jgi:lipoprotein-anchoring transpeptidase ErfK/SrfK
MPDAPSPPIDSAAKEEARAAAPVPAAAQQKIDTRLANAMKKKATEPGQPPTLNPDIPIQDGGNVLVDIKGSVSKEMLEQVVVLGGKVVSGDEPADTVRAMVPLTGLETLAKRPDVESISPATPTITSKVGSSQGAASGASNTQP